MTIHTLFPNKVYLDPIAHKYFDNEGLEYMGFSRLYGYLVPKFDSDGISRIMARNSGVSQEEIQAGWNKSTENGTRIDKALELYAQTATFLPEDADIKDLVVSVLEKYKGYNRTYEQGIPYDLERRLAGSWDKLSLVSNRKDSKFHLSDFKCFAKGYDSLFKISGQSFLNAPFSHLPNNKYTKICFQLSYYAHLFEELTGRKCEKLFIDLITPSWNEDGTLNSYKNEAVPAMYMKNDVKLLLEYFKDKIVSDMTPNAAYSNLDIEEF
jgi:hypothetical protein